MGSTSAWRGMASAELSPRWWGGIATKWHVLKHRFIVFIVFDDFDGWKDFIEIRKLPNEHVVSQENMQFFDWGSQCSSWDTSSKASNCICLPMFRNRKLCCNLRTLGPILIPSKWIAKRTHEIAISSQKAMDCNEQENQACVSSIWRSRNDRMYLIYQTSKPVKCIKITKENLLLDTGQVGAKTGQRFFATFACVRDCLPNFPITFSPRLQDTFTLYRSKGVETCRGVARCCYSLVASYKLNISLSMFQWFANVSINCLSHYVIGIIAGSEFNMTYLKASRILPLMRPGEPWHYIVCFRFVCPAWYDAIL